MECAMKWIRALTVASLACCAADAQNYCRFYLMDHYDFANNVGTAIDLESSNYGPGDCTLGSVSLILAVGNGTNFVYASVSPAWSVGHTYTAKAVLTAAGPQQLYLDGQLVATAAGAFQPMPGALLASEVPSWANGQAAYSIEQTGLQVANANQGVSLPAAGTWTEPSPPLLLLGGTPLWASSLAEDPSQTLTVTMTFQIQDAPPAAAPYNPYVDQYGQSTYSDWPSKIHSDADLAASAAAEQTWLAANPPLPGIDAYGGSTAAGWRDVATGYYRTAQHGGRWWLITPLGTPCFYIALSTVQPGASATPITGRTAEFASLPPSGGTYSSAYSQNYWGNSADQTTTYFRFDTANSIRKYGSQWPAVWQTITTQRLASWGFSGMGKWSLVSPHFPTMPVLDHGAVPNVIQGGHPDTFNPAIVSQLKATLVGQIGNNVTNPQIVGWSVGNELAEDIQASEVTAILALGASTPAKQAFVDHAASAIYGGSVGALAAAWRIQASTLSQAYAATPNPPAADIENLREYYENQYYQTIYQTVKGIDPNHLYLGNWVDPGYWVSSTDWNLIAANTDVIGFDYYALRFASTYNLDALIQSTDKPVFVGEFSFPPNYDGQRGFGSLAVSAESESQAGDWYAAWLKAAAAAPNCVGVSWFEFEDEPVSGRGVTSGSNAGAALVYGEDYAFGMVDATDQPKYDLVNKVRAANQTVLQSLGLLDHSLGQFSSAAGGVLALSPGANASVYGSDLSTGPPTAPSLPWPLTVSGTTVTLVDSTGTSIQAPLNYASATQINFLIPATVATGPATVTVTSGAGTISSSRTALVPLAPAVYTLNASNLAAAYVDCVTGSTQTLTNPFQVSGSALIAQSIDLTACDESVLLLFGTGFDRARTADVTVMFDNTPGSVLYAGPQGTWPGLDQVNVAIPKSLAGAGNVAVVLSAGGIAANVVNLSIR
jgi:uncharacterized protein (TIGR03437 family)